MSKLGLALGGGGARGLAHIGVLKVLDDEGIKVNAITGCSMGAVVGGLYACFGSAKKVEEYIFSAVDDQRFARLGLEVFSENGNDPGKSFFEQLYDYVGRRLHAIKTLNRLSYFDENITSELFKLIPDIQIESLGIKFSAVATDLISGSEINFTKGSLRNAIKASSAIPGIYPPVKIDDYFLIDGSASESVPAGKVKEIGADRVLAVDVTRNINVERPTNNILDILYRAEDITSFHLSQVRLIEADLIIKPDVKNLSWADFNKISDIIAAGESAAKENLPSIKKLVNRNSILLELEQYIKKFKGEE